MSDFFTIWLVIWIAVLLMVGGLKPVGGKR